MTDYYYDVAVIGMEIGPLTAGALLAKRGFRVLVLGHGADCDRYSCCGFEFSKRPFRMIGSESFAVRRIIDDLGISQLWQHAIRRDDPMWQIVLPNARLDIGRNPRHITREVKRELPPDAKGLDDAIEAVGRINGEISKLLAGDFLLPPETFFEKREFARIEVQNPFRLPYGIPGTKKAANIPDYLMLPCYMESAGNIELHPIVKYRQLGGWLFDCVAFENGIDGIRKILLEQIIGQGGDVHPTLSADEIEVTRGSVTAILVHGRSKATGCRAILTHLSPYDLSKLIKPVNHTKQFRNLIEKSIESALGYSVNLGMDSEVIPEGLAQVCFLQNHGIIGDELLRIEKIPQKDHKKAALNLSCIVPHNLKEDIETGSLRDRILDKIRRIIPYLDQYLHVIHSPFDSFGSINLRETEEGNNPTEISQENVSVWKLFAPNEKGTFGAGVLPHRTGIKGLLLAGSQALRGLGIEGEMQAAWGAARIVRKMDPRRERLVKSIRAKVEL